jgi:signal transduction histidine kinase
MKESLRPSDSILGTSLRGFRQVQTRDLLRTEEHHFVSLIREEKLHSMLVTPVVYEEDAIGVLSLYVDRPHRFNDDEKLIARALADLGAIAVQNTRLYGRVFDSEESLRKSERLTTLGTLAAEIAHEIRNPLMVISLLFDSLDLEHAQDEQKNKDLSVIREKLDHLEQIAGRILDFGKSREAFRKTFSLHEIIQDAAVLVRLKLEQSQVTLQINENDQNILVYVDKGQIQQVLLNLMLNALVVMGNGGEIILELGRVGDRAQVFVKDTGSGIPFDLQERIFDSFLTGSTDGTGLGLSISKRILRAHDGDLELVESGQNGTTFRISLPLVNAES